MCKIFNVLHANAEQRSPRMENLKTAEGMIAKARFEIQIVIELTYGIQCVLLCQFQTT